MTPAADGAWPPLRDEPQVWDWQGARPRSRDDRLFRDYRSAVVPLIGDRDLRLGRDASAALNEASAAIIRLEADENSRLVGLAGALLRSESVGSSKIEHLDTDAQGLAAAAIGEAGKTSPAAQVWANVEAMQRALEVAHAPTVTAATIDSIHHVLMRPDPYEAEWAGRVRDVQNWIGGSDECPRDALFVPPAPSYLPPLMDDLARWCDRADLHVLAQAAIAHAQFETIHPYTDGNGRTGRALIHTVLRRHGHAPSLIVPTSSALLADVNGYFDSLGAYRDGDVDSYLDVFAGATTRAAHEAANLGADLREVSNDWRDAVKLREGTAVARLLDGLLRQPLISAAKNAISDSDDATIYRAIDRLVGGGILTEITENRRNRIWVATDVTAALDEFARRIGRRRDAR